MKKLSNDTVFSKYRVGEDLFYFILTLFSAIMCIFLYGNIDFIPGETKGDLISYRRMAEAFPGLSTKVPSPWGYRILPSYLVGLLPFSVNFGFWLLSLFFSFGVVTLFYKLMLLFNISPFWAFFTLTIFFFNRYLFGIVNYNFFQLVDLMSLFWLLLAIICYCYDCWWLLLISGLLGVLTKELILLIVPAFGFHLYSHDTNWKKKNALLGIILVLFFVIRLFVGPSENAAYLWERIVLNIERLFSFRHWGEILINAFTPLGLLPFVFYQETLDFFKRYSYLLILFLLCAVSTLFAGTAERLMIPAAIPFYLLMANIFMKRMKDNDWKIWAIFTISFICLFHHEIGIVSYEERKITVWIYVFSTINVTLLGVFGKYLANQKF